jgi:hypothetical protein
MKGPSYEQGTRLQAAAGLHHLLANHLHVLVNNPLPPLWCLLTSFVQSETLDKQFEKPLRQHLDTYRSIVHVRALLLVSITCRTKPLDIHTGTLILL